MLATILGLITSLFNGGLQKAGKGLEWIFSLLKPTLQEQKQSHAEDADKESQELDKGGRPQW